MYTPPSMVSFVSTGPLEVPRMLGRVSGTRPGALLVAVGGIHGNEHAGVLAIQNVLEILETDRPVRHGTFVGLAGNLAALAAGRRFLDRDLNRIWATQDRLDDHEAAERAGLERTLEAVLREHDGPVLVVDCHTSSGPCPPFALPWPGPRLARAVAGTLGAPVVTGFEGHLEGLLIEWLAARNLPAMALELGAPLDKATAVLTEALFRAAAALGMTEPDGAHGGPLDGVPAGVPAALHVVYGHRIPQGSRFEMLPGFSTFDRVRQDQLLAHEDGRPIRAPLDGWILLPKYQPEGEDGFFIAVEPG